MGSKRWMSNIRKRYGLGISCVVLGLVATSCFRDTSEAIERQPVAREVASPTVMIAAEDLATQIPDVVVEEAIASEAPPDTFALTATALIARLTELAESESTDVPSNISVVEEEPAAEDESPVVVATAVPVVRSTVVPGEDCVHEIRAGETLFMLSLAYGSTVDAIAEASEIENPDRLAIGQRITIPECGTTGFAPPPTSLPPPTAHSNAIESTTETELEIAAVDDGEEHTVLIQQAQDALLNNAQSGLSGGFSALSAEIATPSQTYTLQQGETLLEIALRFNTTLEVLAALNGITDVDDVDAGDVLQIP